MRARPSITLEGRGWTAELDGTTAVIVLFGDWFGRSTGVEPGSAQRILGAGLHSLSFNVDKLRRWDSALIAFLSILQDAARKDGVAFDEAGLPPPARQLLALAMGTPAAVSPPAAPPLLERIGQSAISIYAEATEVAAVLGSTLLRGWAALCGRSLMRGNDLLDCMQGAGVMALPIITVVNLLVGAILAFVGSVQLRRFGADVYVASLVGLTIVRDMAALMTAIIMAGRTGSTYAANIATMQGNEELDALRVFGIPVFDYLILPRVLALTGMMPILYLYGCAIGIFGGFAVAVAALNISPTSFVTEIRGAVSYTQFAIGLTKSLAFGLLIAVAGCRSGLRAGRSAADVGQAATSAVVASIVGIILLDATFALCANALGL